MNRILNVIMILGLMMNLAFAKEATKAPVLINAKAVTYNYKTGVDVYEGDVTIQQGDAHITADRVVTKSDTHRKILEAIAYGAKTPAHYWTTPSNQPTLHAHANIIKFYPLTSNISLEQQARLIQGKNSFQGSLIHYNSADQTITMPPSNAGRAVIVYNPE